MPEATPATQLRRAGPWRALALALDIDRAWRWCHAYLRLVDDAEVSEAQKCGIVDGVLPPLKALRNACQRRIGMNDLALPAAQHAAAVDIWPADTLAMHARTLGHRAHRARDQYKRLSRDHGAELMAPLLYGRPMHPKTIADDDVLSLDFWGTRRDQMVAQRTNLSFNHSLAVIAAAAAAHQHLHGLEQRRHLAASRMNEIRKAKGAA